MKWMLNILMEIACTVIYIVIFLPLSVLLYIAAMCLILFVALFFPEQLKKSTDNKKEN